MSQVEGLPERVTKWYSKATESRERMGDGQVQLCAGARVSLE
jgi:hypothetical protein